MAAATVTSKGQITIPKEIRDALGIETGDEIVFRIRADGVVELYQEALDLRSLRGILKSRRRGVSLAAMERAIGAGAVER